MELNFIENQTYNNNYWEEYQANNHESYTMNTTNTNSNPKKKKVSFDDILSNMNLVVNQQGILQFMGAAKPEVPINTQNQEPVQPAVKHSYIYNKYFKNYVDPNAEVYVPKVPKTREEYYQMLLEERIKRIELQKHLEQVKSKKLMLTSAATPGLSSNRNIQASKNTLNRLQFR
jgi:hypothetical protein